MPLLVVLFCTTAPTFAADKKTKIDDDVLKTTAKGYEWLAKQQNSDGSWGDANYPNNTAITGFALLAFMSQGNLPTEGKYAKEVAKGVRFLMASQREDGYLIGARGGNMYCHGMATLALSQVWGMTGDEDVKTSLKKAVNLIVKCQCKDNSMNHGGWRYEPVPSGADISVTIMQVMALRGAKDSGIHVPDETMKRALSYINSCYDEASGGYTYMPRNRHPGFARTAAGICVLKLVGEYDKKIERSVDYLKKTMENPRRALLVRPLLRLPRLSSGRRQRLGRILQVHQNEVCRNAIARRQLVAPRPAIGRPGLSNVDRHHRLVRARKLFADLPAIIGEPSGVSGRVIHPAAYAARFAKKRRSVRQFDSIHRFFVIPFDDPLVLVVDVFALDVAHFTGFVLDFELEAELVAFLLLDGEFPFLFEFSYLTLERPVFFHGVLRVEHATVRAVAQRKLKHIALLEADL